MIHPDEKERMSMYLVEKYREIQGYGDIQETQMQCIQMDQAKRNKQEKVEGTELEKGDGGYQGIKRRKKADR